MNALKGKKVDFKRSKIDLEISELKEPIEIIKGIFIKADSPTKGGSIYPEELLVEVIKEFQKTLESYRIVGNLIDRNNPKGDPSHCVSAVNYLEDGTVEAVLEIFDNSAGRKVSEASKEGKIYLVPSFIADRVKEKDGFRTVVKAKLITINIAIG